MLILVFSTLIFAAVNCPGQPDARIQILRMKPQVTLQTICRTRPFPLLP